MTEWQPIETAPKDGTEILLLAHGMAIQARYVPGGWSEDTPVNPAEYDGAIWCAFDDAIQFEIEETPEGDHHGPVTHWQPLPEPPASGIETEGQDPTGLGAEHESPVPNGETPPCR